VHLSPIAGDGLKLPPPSSARAIPPLPDVDRSPPAIQVALPHGGQTQLPGVLWPNPSVWTLSDSLPRTADPPIAIRQLNRKQANVLTGAWHDLGAEARPFAYTAFALYVQDEPVAVATAGTTVSASVDQSAGLDRLNTIELTRVTYSLPGKKGGDLYRFDGWRRLRDCRPWHGNGTWQHGSRVGTPEALWVYWLPTGRRPTRRDRESTPDTPDEITQRGRLPRRREGRGARPLPRGRGEVR
jgi:hypothetical protein